MRNGKGRRKQGWDHRKGEELRNLKPNLSQLEIF
jgi:hypothetical protein